MKVILQIIDFDNCKGCQRKVRNILSKIHGAESVQFDPESGDISVSTGEQPGVIRHALELGMKRKVVLVSQDIVPVNQNAIAMSRHQAPAVRTYSDLRELGEVMRRMPPNLDSVEITHSNTTRVTFNYRDNPPPEARTSNGGVVITDENDVHVEYTPRQPTLRAPPWPAVEPSAPPISNTENAVYGYPAEYIYGSVNTTTRTHDHPDGSGSGCCSIM